MKYSDMHMHGYYSDGKGRPFEFAEKAAERNIDTLGFSDHSPVPLENDWSMKLDSLNEYMGEIIELKKECKGTPDIYLGLELDYIPGIDVKKYIGFEKLPLDYFIGSVHYVYSKKLEQYFEVDGSLKDFEYLLNAGFGGNARKLYSEYYSNVRKMIEDYKPVVAAHIDLIVKNNKKDRYFDENEPAYRTEVDKTLEMVKKYGTSVEINAGGMSRGYMEKPYPSEYILRKCLEKGIAVTLNSDAHSPGDTAYQFDKIKKSIHDIGFRETLCFKKGKWIAVRL